MITFYRRDGSVALRIQVAEQYTQVQCFALESAIVHGDVVRDLDLANANLNYAELHNADLSGCDLRGAEMEQIDLKGANLTGVEIGYPVPVVPDLDRKILARIDAGACLAMDSWHTCGSTHCRAGWAIALAGDEGAALEDEIGPAAAGAFIYFASEGYVPDFYTDDADAMADMRHRVGTR